jgi:integrase
LIFGEKVKASLSALLSVLNDVNYTGPWVFPTATGHGRLLEQPLTVSGVRLMFKRRLKQADLPMYSVHDLRHTFTKEAIHAKKPLPSIQKQLGHSSPTMVLYYAECFDADQRRDFCDFGD